MPKGKPECIEYNGLPHSLRELADAAGIAYTTMKNRWQSGDRGIERLTRPADIRFSSAKRKAAKVCVNSLLAGWKSVPGALEAQTDVSQSASTQTEAA